MADAQAISPTLMLFDADPAADLRALEALACWCVRYAPTVARWGDDTLILDIEGCDAVHGGEEALLIRVRQDFIRLGINVCVGIADTPRAALASAFLTKADAIIARGETRAALANLPLSGLRLDFELERALRRLGWRCIGDLYNIPRGSLETRFGKTIVRVLAEILGEVTTPLLPVHERPRYGVRRSFVEPIGTPEQFAKVAEDLSVVLARDLERDGMGATHLSLTFFTVDGRAAEIEQKLAGTSRDPKHIAKLLTMKLETIDPGEGIDAACLSAKAVAPFKAHQAVIANAHNGPPLLDDRALSMLVDRLTTRLGEGHVYRLAEAESHIPERAIRRMAPVERAPVLRKVPRVARPIRLFRRPEPIEAIAPVPDEPPAQIRWRRVPRRIVRADGPERIAPEWWKPRDAQARERDYYRIEDEEGRRYWVFRAGRMDDPTPAQWFVHGVFH